MFRFPHYKSGQPGCPFKDRNFVPGIMLSIFGLCRPGALARNGVTGDTVRRGPWVRKRHQKRQRILVSLALCTALAGECFADAQADIAAEAVARGKALVDAGDCASCHTADNAKSF